MSLLSLSVEGGTLLESVGPGVWVGTPVVSHPTVILAMVAPLRSPHRVSSTRGLIARSREGKQPFCLYY